jgi:hypothetical protein
MSEPNNEVTTVKDGAFHTAYDEHVMISSRFSAHTNNPLNRTWGSDSPLETSSLPLNPSPVKVSYDEVASEGDNFLRD